MLLSAGLFGLKDFPCRSMPDTFARIQEDHLICTPFCLFRHMSDKNDGISIFLPDQVIFDMLCRDPIGCG